MTRQKARPRASRGRANKTEEKRSNLLTKPPVQSQDAKSAKFAKGFIDLL